MPSAQKRDHTTKVSFSVEAARACELNTRCTAWLSTGLQASHISTLDSGYIQPAHARTSTRLVT